MALTEGFGAGGFDGFLIAEVTRTARGPSGSVSDIDLAVSVAFDAVVPRDVHLAVGPHGPLTTFQSGHAYFLTLHRATDSTLPPLFVDPCGPAFEVSSASDLNYLLSLRDDETVVDGGYLSNLRQSFSREALFVPLLAVASAVVALVIVAGVLSRLPRRRGASPDS